MSDTVALEIAVEADGLASDTRKAAKRVFVGEYVLRTVVVLVGIGLAFIASVIMAFATGWLEIIC